MDFVKQYKKINPKDSGPFSDAQLEADWNDEINTMYEDEEKQYFDRISHKDFLYITTRVVVGRYGTRLHCGQTLGRRFIYNV